MNGKIQRIQEITCPRVPREARSRDTVNLAFLSVMWDFGFSAVTKNCMYIREAVLEVFKDRSLLDLPLSRTLERVSARTSFDVDRLRNGMDFAFETMWEGCDGKAILGKYFPYEPERKMPHYSETDEFFRFIFEIVDRRRNGVGWLKGYM